MIDSISSINAGAVASTAVISDAPPRNPAKPDIDAEKSAKPVDVAPLSPRLRPDFLSGTIVTEFVGNNGQITQQSPTVAALAYLRAGLDANGQQQVDPNAPRAPAEPDVRIA